MTYTLSIYKEWLAAATQEQISIVDAIYQECEKHYSDGGDTIVECFGPKDVLGTFVEPAEKKVAAGPAPGDRNEVRRIALILAREECGLKVEQALNARWGEDTDEELDRAKRFDEWE